VEKFSLPKGSEREEDATSVGVGGVRAVGNGGCRGKEVCLEVGGDFIATPDGGTGRNLEVGHEGQRDVTAEEGVVGVEGGEEGPVVVFSEAPGHGGVGELAEGAGVGPEN
jgi:hypothetical protein